MFPKNNLEVLNLEWLGAAFISEAEEIAVIKERLFNDYMKTLPRYQSSQQSDEAEEEVITNH